MRKKQLKTTSKPFIQCLKREIYEVFQLKSRFTICIIMPFTRLTKLGTTKFYLTTV